LRSSTLIHKLGTIRESLYDARDGKERGSSIDGSSSGSSREVSNAQPTATTTSTTLHVTQTAQFRPGSSWNNSSNLTTTASSTTGTGFAFNIQSEEERDQRDVSPSRQSHVSGVGFGPNSLVGIGPNSLVGSSGPLEHPLPIPPLSPRNARRESMSKPLPIRPLSARKVDQLGTSPPSDHAVIHTLFVETNRPAKKKVEKEVEEESRKSLDQPQPDIAEADRSSSSRISTMARAESVERRRHEKRKKIEKIVRDLKEQINALEEELKDL
jgi:hypothetical protein